MSSKLRKSVLIYPKVKNQFDEVHKGLKQGRDEHSQSDTIKFLLDFYLKNGPRITV